MGGSAHWLWMKALSEWGIRNEEWEIRNEGGGFAANIYGRCPKVACDWGLSRIVISSVSENSFLLPPSHGRGMPEGQGVGRRRNRAKPTSGAMRHLLPEEGGRNRSKCIVLYTSSLKAGYSYSLFMNLHRLNGFKRFTGFPSFANTVYSKIPRRLDPLTQFSYFSLRKHWLNRYQISFLDFYTERGDIRRE